jgi:chemotaxis protein MotB
MNSSGQVIIIKRKKAHGGHGHHGGAWKVAYADFVTAMMSLFIVLWLLSSSEQVKKAVGGYFTDPTGKSHDVGNGLHGNGAESIGMRKDDMNKLKEKLEAAIKDSAPLSKIREHVIFTITGEGLRVELIEDEHGIFFASGSAVPSEYGRELLAKLAGEIGKLPNKVTMEGHTDSRPYSGTPNYSNWELSADRANAARRWMQQHGMREDQVTQVRGFADQSLRDPAHPDEASNRRITLIIQYQPRDEPAAGKEDVAAKPETAAGTMPETLAGTKPAAAAGAKPATAPAQVAKSSNTPAPAAKK